MSEGAENRETGWQPIDLLLEQGDAAELAAMRAQVAADPLLALDVGETVAFVEQMRQLCTEPSASFPVRLQQVVKRAARCQVQRRTGVQRLLPLVTLLSAAAGFAALWLLDPLSSWRDRPAERARVAALHEPASPRTARQTSGEADAPVVEVIDARELAWLETLEQVRQHLRRQQTASELLEAFERGVSDKRDTLSDWLEPRNAMMLRALDHELRSSAEVRTAALVRRGALAVVDDRVQELADQLVDAFLADSGAGDSEVGDLSFGIRALIAAGSNPARAAALRQAGRQLGALLPALHGESLVLALSAMTEVAAITGEHGGLVAQHGTRLVDAVLRADDDTWTRYRPDLLSPHVQPANLGEAGRLMAVLPAFGVDMTRCALVRELAAGQLRDLRHQGQERPEVLAALVYGFEDLLDDAERDRLLFSLRRWQLVRLAPDFVTVQQIAWSLRPGSVGFSRLQDGLRRLAVLPAPPSLAGRAAFCMCLATNFAGFVGDLSGGALSATSKDRRAMQRRS